MLEGVSPGSSQDVVLECHATGAGVTVQGAGTYVIGRAVLYPVVVDVGVGVSVLVVLRLRGRVTVPPRPDVDRPKVAEDAAAKPVHVVVGNVKDVTTSVVLAIVHWPRHPA